MFDAGTLSTKEESRIGTLKALVGWHRDAYLY
jgi:hypothetical protein